MFTSNKLRLIQFITWDIKVVSTFKLSVCVCIVYSKWLTHVSLRFYRVSGELMKWIDCKHQFQFQSSDVNIFVTVRILFGFNQFFGVCVCVCEPLDSALFFFFKKRRYKKQKRFTDSTQSNSKLKYDWFSMFSLYGRLSAHTMRIHLFVFHRS